ncbi:uncharacterized protein LOC128418492 isoform X1 [Podarcis raffonei]|uniref:uncharacterized protein LOC128418492 isoform X1 n=1 Tax=Podarcis raffonei TaxID=65483 RepID=UPI002329279C|nr:uncharacterized protein LOC128418492 isoform X1 [Podarcis raffonei]
MNFRRSRCFSISSSSQRTAKNGTKQANFHDVLKNASTPRSLDGTAADQQRHLLCWKLAVGVYFPEYSLLGTAKYQKRPGSQWPLDYLRRSRLHHVLVQSTRFFSLLCVCISFERDLLFNISLLRAAVTFSLVSALLILIGMAIFTYVQRHSQPYTNYSLAFGSSYGLGWASVPMHLITAVLQILSHKTSTY